jgi:hypothetical protein
MQTVRDACQLQSNALSIKLSDQIEQLDELITAEGDGAQFFDKTYITQGMQDLISEGMARLAGVSTQGIFHLKQAMGGGKTHLLVGFGLLAKHPELRQKYCGGLPYAQAFEVADIAAFNGRNNPDHFFWGEIANQLGKGEQFKTFWTSGPKAPDEKDWLQLTGDRPEDWQRSRYSGRLAAVDRQSLDRGQRREGSHPRGNGRVPRVAIARAVGVPDRL